MRRNPRYRKLKLILLGAVAGLVALELCLQVVSFVVWKSRGSVSTPVAGDTRPTVLCVGDSFTYGLGASDKEHNAYPAAAERELARLAPERAMRFVNAGWPGSDSKAVLATLAGQLAVERPRFVYVLIGYNDFWSEREPGDGSSFPIEFRTWRLMTLLVSSLLGGPEGGVQEVPSIDRSEAPFLGEWYQGPVWIAFRVDGRVETSNGELPALWSLDRDGLWLDLRDKPERTRVEFRIEDDALFLKAEMFPDGIVLARGLPQGDALARGRTALLRGELTAAEASFREALVDPELAKGARLDLAMLLAGHDRAPEAGALIDAARSAFDAAPDPATGRRLVDAYFAVARVGDASRLLEALLVEGPIDDAFVQHVVRVGLRVDDPKALDAALARALERPALTTKQRIGLLGLRPVLNRDDDDLALRCLVEVARAGPDPSTFARMVVWNPERFTRGRFMHAALELGLSGEDFKRVIAAFDEAMSSPDLTHEHLVANLGRIVIAARENGAEPVLLDYPAERPAITRAVDAVAETLGVGRVRLVEHFRQLVAASRREDWYIADGHCNDRGYVEMGRLVAEDVLARMGR